MIQSPWWQGKRGEWYVVIQIVLFILVALGPRTLNGGSFWPGFLNPVGVVAGPVLGLVGAWLLITAFFRLGTNLTPLPYPKAEGTLIQTGPYGWVRHPIYSGGVLMALGWAVWVQSGLTLGYAVLLFVFFEIKSSREEVWLNGKFPEYAEYKKRVRKLIPFIY